MRQPTTAATATFDPTAFAGLVLTVAIAAAAFAVHGLPGMAAVSPAILGAIAGMVIAHAVKLPKAADAGIGFSSRTLLRVAVAMLGLQVTVPQVMALGVGGFAVSAGGLIVSFVAIKALGRWLGVEARLAELIAAGTSICGASAVAGVNTVTEAGEDDVAYAVAMVTLFGSVAMLAWPILGHGFDARHFGLWAGASIHEVAQVAGAAAQVGPEAVQTAAVAKLTRIALLAPLVFGLRTVKAKTGKNGAGKVVGMPWFLLVFAALVAIGSVVTIPADVKAVAAQVSSFLLAMALAGMGLKTHIKGLMAKGWRPLLLGALGTALIGSLTFAAVTVLP